MSGSSTCRSGGRRRALAGVLALAGAVTIATSVRALDAERGISQYLRDRWGSESGFPGGPVYAIAQTSDGYLWIGAEKGLVRFDGLTFRLIDAGSGDATPGPRCSAWPAPRTAACGRGSAASASSAHRAGQFDNLLADQGAPRSVVTAMARGRDGAMLLATLAHGALAYRGGRFEPVTVPGDAAQLVVRHLDRRRPPTARSGSAPATPACSGSAGRSVSRHADGLPDLKINCLLAAPAGEVWIGTDRGVARWNGTEITQAGVPAALRDTPALGLTRDRESNLWVAAGARGLLRVGPDGSGARGVPRPGGRSDTWRRPSRTATATCGSGPIAASNAGAIPCSRRIRVRRACRPMPAVPFMRPRTDGSGSVRRAAACSGSATARCTR